MKARPILFNGDMVRALLAGRKTQTRRVMKPQPEKVPVDYSRPGHWWPSNTVQSMVHVEAELQNQQGGWEGLAANVCPHGEKGDLLWVREAFGYEIRNVGGTPHKQITFRATSPDAVHCYDSNGTEQAMKWKPSLHMPRHASRLTLRITDVRVERLQEISEEDAKAEGLRYHSLYNEWGGVEKHPASRANLPQWRWYENPVTAFQHLWESINGPESWSANPWVWVIEFEVIQANVDTVLKQEVA